MTKNEKSNISKTEITIFFVFMFPYTVHRPEQESVKSGDGYFWQILILVRARCEVQDLTFKIEVNSRIEQGEYPPA